MTINQANGKAYQLNGPNKLSRNSGRFWDHSIIKYVNFAGYGDKILLDPVKLITPIIPKKDKEPVEQPKEFLGSNLNNLGHSNIKDDNYLDDSFDQEFEVEKYDSEQKNKIKNIDNNKYKLEGGSPVIYRFIDPIEGPKEIKIYAQIENLSKNKRIYIISKNQNVQIDNIIICEWEKSFWKIIDPIEIVDNFKRVTSILIS